MAQALKQFKDAPNCYPDLGIKVRQIMDDEEIRVGSLTAALAPVLGMSPTTLSSSVSAIRGGRILGYSVLEIVEYVSYTTRLDRTAAVLHYIGFPIDDPSLEQVRIDHPRFRFPPLKPLPQHNTQPREEALTLVDKISMLTPEDRQTIATAIDAQLQQYRSMITNSQSDK